MRIFRDCEEMIKEMDRELKSSGISVKVKHYQNKLLEGEDQITKELLATTFCISHAMQGIDQMIKYIFPDDYVAIKEYCLQEIADRTCGQPLNPGNSYKKRLSLWQKFLVGDEKEVQRFHYTYPERIVRSDQLKNALDSLKDDIHSRRSVIQIFQSDLDSSETPGFSSRVPCSMDYQFLIRNNRLYCVYHTRSTSFYEHFPIDTALTSYMMEYFVKQLQPTYPDLKIGSMYYFGGSFHAYAWNLSSHVTF